MAASTGYGTGLVVEGPEAKVLLSSAALHPLADKKAKVISGKKSGTCVSPVEGKLLVLDAAHVRPVVNASPSEAEREGSSLGAEETELGHRRLLTLTTLNMADRAVGYIACSDQPTKCKLDVWAADGLAVRKTSKQILNQIEGTPPGGERKVRGLVVPPKSSALWQVWMDKEAPANLDLSIYVGADTELDVVDADALRSLLPKFDNAKAKVLIFIRGDDFKVKICDKE